MRANVLILAGLILLLPALVNAAAPETAGRGLPFGLAQAGAATDGKNIYVFGGANGAQKSEPTLTNAIIEMDPATGNARQLNETLPSPRGGASVVWDGHEFLVIGGWAGRDHPLDEIVSFTPGSPPTTLPTKLPRGLSQTGAVWTGTEVLVFGGYTSCGASCPNATRSVLRYHPDSQTLDEARSKFPRGFAEQAAVWVGDRAYLLGGFAGEANATGPTDLIFRYDAAPDTLTQLPVKLPAARNGGAVAFVGANVFLLAGTGASFAPANDILRFDTATERGSITGVSLDVPRVRTFVASAQVGSFAYVIGGAGCPGISDFCREVLVYDLSGDHPVLASRYAPSDVTTDKAAPGAGLAAVLVAVGTLALLWRR